MYVNLLSGNYVGVMLCFCLKGYGCDCLGCRCGGGDVPAARSQRSSDAGEVYAEMQRANYQVNVLACFIQCESKNPHQFFWHFPPKGWEFLVQILHAYYTFLSTMDYKFLFNYLQL